MVFSKESSGRDEGLSEIRDILKQMVLSHDELSAAIDSINGRLNVLSSIDQIRSAPDGDVKPPQDSSARAIKEIPKTTVTESPPPSQAASSDLHDDEEPPSAPSSPQRKASTTSRIILTTYPKQSGIDPLQMEWGAKDPAERGPVVVGRSPSTIRRRNGLACSTIRNETS